MASDDNHVGAGSLISWCKAPYDGLLVIAIAHGLALYAPRPDIGDRTARLHAVQQHLMLAHGDILLARAL